MKQTLLLLLVAISFLSCQENEVFDEPFNLWIDLYDSSNKKCEDNKRGCTVGKEFETGFYLKIGDARNSSLDNNMYLKITGVESDDVVFENKDLNEEIPLNEFFLLENVFVPLNPVRASIYIKISSEYKISGSFTPKFTFKVTNKDGTKYDQFEIDFEDYVVSN